MLEEEEMIWFNQDKLKCTMSAADGETSIEPHDLSTVRHSWTHWMFTHIDVSRSVHCAVIGPRWP
jgi:hypothetical protein